MQKKDPCLFQHFGQNQKGWIIELMVGLELVELVEKKEELA
jgi:hypothetical protein